MTTTRDVREMALGAAMRLFWRRGIAATSYADLVEATSLSRKALYNLWPEKEALVRDSLRHYRQAVLTPVLGRLKPAGAATLVRYWSDAEEDAQQPGWCGCYLMRSAGGEMRRDPEVLRDYDAYLSDLSEAFVDAILAARRDLPRSRVLDVGSAAMQAVSVVITASVIGGQRGYDARVAEAFRAGRLACGLPPA
jgi:AcrR family transcriptional regulator